MLLLKEKNKNISKWAYFSLFFGVFLILFTVSKQVQAAFTEPPSIPPEDNTSEYLRIDGTHQAKSGALRLGTDDATTPFNYQLEVLGEGALMSESIVENNLLVGQSENTLFVDAENNKVCVGPCLDLTGTKLEVSEGGVMAEGGFFGSGVVAYSSDDEAVIGVGNNSYGVQGVSARGVSADDGNYGVWALNTLGTAALGSNTSVPPQYSSVAGVSDTGIGIYGINTNPLGLWAGYFNGRLESNEDISAAKFLSVSLENSLVPYTSSQQASEYALSNAQIKLFDGTYVWVVNGNQLYKVSPTDGFISVVTTVGNNPTDVIYDGSSIWVTLADDDEVKKINPIDGSVECTVAISGSAKNPQSIAFQNYYVTDFVEQSREIDKYYWVTAEKSSGEGVLVKIRYDVDDNNCEMVSNIELTSSAISLGKVIYDGAFFWVLATSNSGQGYVITVNPSSGEAVRWDNLSGDNPQDIFYDNYYYWIANAEEDDGTVTRMYLLDKKICSVDGITECESDSECGSGGCFSLPQAYGTFSTQGQPSYIAYDGMHIWTANVADQSLTRLLAADPDQADHYPLRNAAGTPVTPTGLVFDGTYLLASSSGGLRQIYTGTGFGTANLGDALYLQNKTTMTGQPGHVSLSESGRIEGSMSAEGDIKTQNNVWGEIEGGDTITSIVYGDTWFNTGELQAEEGANNILSFLETSTGTLLVGIEGEHIYRSIDSGVNWSPTTGLSDVDNVYTLLEDPSDSAIYAGTGYDGDVYRSDDDGDTWTNTTNLASGGIDASGVFVLLLASDSKIYAATTGASTHKGKIYETDDGGLNWTVAGVFRNVADDADETPTLVQSLLQASNGDLYAGANNMGAARVYKSIDGGIKWINTAYMFGNEVYSLLEASDNTIYAAISPFGRIYKTINQGSTWSQALNIGGNEINSLIEDSNGYLYAGVGGPGGYWSHGVYKSEDNGNTWPITSELTGSIYVNQLFESSDGVTIYAATGVYSGLFKTTDEGGSWDLVSYLDDVGPTEDAHTIRALIEASDGTFYAGSNNGDVYKSVDKGVTWANTAHLPGVSVVESLLAASDGAIYAGTYPNGDVYKTINQGATWNETTGALTGAIDVNSLIQARNTTTIFAGTDQDVFRSTNGGDSWQALGGPEAKSIIEAADGILYASESNDVYKSTDNGNTWNLAGSIALGNIINVLVEDNTGNIYAAVSANEYVYISTDQGATWNETAGILTGTNNANYQFALIKGSNGAIYVGTGGGGLGANVWETTDAGANWTRLGNPYLDDAIAGCYYVYSLMESSDGTLHAGTRAQGDVVKLELAAMPVNTYTCPAGHFVKNIYTNVLDEVYRIECRGL